MSTDQHRPPEGATASDHEPLPPLPDGGLARVMPDWLRDEPAKPEPPSASAIDPASLVTADDLPDWLRHLGPEPPPAPAPLPASPSPASVTMEAVPPPHERPVTVAIPSPPPDDVPPPTAESTQPTNQVAVHTPASPIHPAPSRVSTPVPQPDLARRKAIVAVLGFLLLVLVVAVYVYARGGL